MEIKDLKVGMKVRAINNYYNFTSKNYKWIGVICGINSNGSFSAKTESSADIDDKNTVYFDLQPQHFEKVVDQEEKITKKEELATKKEIPLKVICYGRNIYVIYKGKTVAKAICSEDDNFNEEFGLNLALRRFCKMLCDENTTEKIVYNTDKVEDFV